MQLVIDCHDATPLVAFWCRALGYVPSPPPAGHASWNDWYRSRGVPDDELDLRGDGTDRIQDPTGQGPAIWFPPVPEAKQGKNRWHLDVYVGRGATDPPLPYAVGLRDPEGNELDLV